MANPIEALPPKLRRMNHRTLPLVALLLAVLAGGTAVAQTQWKWRDAQGQIQYSDRPPPAGTPDKDILSRPAGANTRVQVIDLNAPRPVAAKPAAPAASTPEERRRAQDLAKAKAEDAAKQRQVDEANAQAKRQNCQSAQQALRNLEAGGRLKRVNEKGETVFIDDAERQAEIRTARDVAQRNCS